MKNFYKILFAAALLAPSLAPAQIAEPATVFYGQVVNRTSGQPNQLTQGTLQWAIRRADGKTLTLTAKLESLGNGRFSYRIAVPHEALTYGLTVSDASVPLMASSQTASHLLITVDGATATILAPGKATFDVAESLRAATYRLDLEVTGNLADTAGDGIPDWWKARYGITNPNADGDGDGWSNLQEFLHGGNPNVDNRIPSLATAEFWAYAEGTTEIPLDAVDSDTAPAYIHYTLTTLPSGGVFYLHNVANNGSVNDVALGQNGFFSQDDVNQGRLVFVHNQTNASAAPTSFTVALADENPAHTTNFTVTLNVYRPGYSAAVNDSARTAAAAPAGCGDLPGFAFGEQQMLINYYLSRDHGYILADSSRAGSARTNRAASASATAGLDHSYVLVGGAGDDRLIGGTAGDILIGGRGKDTLRGNGGGDLFIIAGTDSGNKTIEDFKTNDGDALDISRCLNGASAQLTNYVQLTTSGTNTICGLNFSGVGPNFTNQTVTLLGVQLTTASLRSLVDGGNLITGSKTVTPIVTITASIPAASQNGPVSGQFTLSRSGSLGAALSVSLTISGSAVNGSSYELISSVATFAVGQRTLNLAVNPFQTTAALTAVAQISIAAGSGYETGSFTSAQVSIEPLAPQLTIEAIVPTAIKSTLTPGTFLVTRSGIVDRSVLVRLTIGGTASSATDFVSFSTLVNLAPNQTTALISVMPRSTANVSGIPRFVQVSLKPDATYKILNPATDRVFIVDQLLTHDAWRSQFFPGNSEDWSTFANRDSGNAGIKNLHRYAFGLNPTNPVATTGLPLYRILNDRLCVTFHRPLAVTDFDYIVEVSDDLINWSALGGDVESFTPANANTNDFESVSYRGKASVNGRAKQFMRVHLQPR